MSRKNVVITGSTKGFGLALAKEFLNYGDNVVISSRNQEYVETIVSKLRTAFPTSQIEGMLCDVSISSDVENLANFLKEKYQRIDIWINNAGISGYANLVDHSETSIKNTVITNLYGTLIGCKEALKLMIPQKSGHIFNVGGKGSDGKVSPKMTVYGATKCAITQLTKSLAKETKKTGVGIHYLQPGMMVTDFLIPYTSPETASIFNILPELPEAPAKYLVGKIQKIRGTGKALRYTNFFKIMWKFITAKKRKNRFFDDEGNLIVELNKI